MFGSEDAVNVKVRLHQGLSHKMKVLLEYLDAVHAREMMEVEKEHRKRSWKGWRNKPKKWKRNTRKNWER